MFYLRKTISQIPSVIPESNSWPRAIQLLKSYPNINGSAKQALDIIKPYFLDIMADPLRILLENKSIQTQYTNDELTMRFNYTKNTLISLFEKLPLGKNPNIIEKLTSFLEEPIYDLTNYEEAHPEQFENQHWRKYADAYAHLFIASINLLFALIIKHGHDKDPVAIYKFKKALEKYVCETPSNAFCVNNNQTILLSLLFTVQPGIAKNIISQRLKKLNMFPNSNALADLRFLIFLLRNFYKLQHLLNKEFSELSEFLPKWKKITEENPLGLYACLPAYFVGNTKYYLENCIKLFS